MYSIMSPGKFALCTHARSGNFLNLENVSITAICLGNVPVLTKDSNGPKLLRTCFRNVRVDRCSAIPDNENVIA